MDDRLITKMKHYGVSPWEIEAAYTDLDARFKVELEEIEQDDPNFVSGIQITIPLPFNEAFFKWFEYPRWDKLKFLFREMKRRRGKGKDLKIEIKFVGNPNITFMINSNDSQWFNNSVEKIDSVLELLPYHFDPKKLPGNVTEAIYLFDDETVRWKLNIVYANDEKFQLNNNSWKIIT